MVGWQERKQVLWREILETGQALRQESTKSCGHAIQSNGLPIEGFFRRLGSYAQN